MDLHHHETVADSFRFFLVISNLFYLLPAYTAFLCELYATSFVLASTGAISYFYHLCWGYDACIYTKSGISFMDQTFASSSVIAVVVAFCCALRPHSRRYEAIHLVISIMFNGIFVSIRSDVSYMDWYQLLFIILYSLFVIFTSLSLHSKFYNYYSSEYRHHNHHHQRTSVRPEIYIPNPCYGKLVAGIACFVVGYVLFICVASISLMFYNIMHSLWHIFSAIGADLILQAARSSEEQEEKYLHPNS